MSGVCFATLDGFAGCVSSCLNAAAVLGASWAEIPLRGETPSSVLEADLLVLSSWHVRYETIIEERRGHVYEQTTIVHRGEHYYFRSGHWDDD